EAFDDTAVTAYRIYQDGELIGTVDGGTLQYDVTGLTDDTAYTFEIEAEDAAGNWSVERLTVQATTLEEPAAPTPTPTQPPTPTPESTPRPTPQPEVTKLPEHVADIPSNEWPSSPKDDMTIDLPEGKTELLLPADAASKLGDRTLAIKGK